MCVVAQSCPGKPVICMRASQRMQHSPYLQAIYNRAEIQVHMGFPGSSAGKELACNAGDPGSIHGSGRSPGEGIGYPLLYSWASLVAQLVKNPPAMWETWVRPLGWKNPLEEGMATHSSILAWRIPWTKESGELQSAGSQRVGHDWVTEHIYIVHVSIIQSFYH